MSKRLWIRRLARLSAGVGALWGLSHLVYRFTAPPPPAQPLRIAHRGASALEPENTLAAFRQAAALKVDLWETDVRQTRDGVLVLMHDGSVDRTTGGHGPVEAMTAAQAAQLGVPTFEEFLELARQERAGILPEVKGRTPGIEAALVRSLEAADMLEPTCVQSFSLTSLEKLHQLSPGLKLCRTCYPWVLWLGTVPEGVSAVAPMAEALLLNPWMVRQAHSRGLLVWPWFAGLESDFTVKWILSLGVDGLMLDDPRR